ncbi:MAG: accessory factor UbiK family protein [Pseudomonadota bacterium]
MSTPTAFFEHLARMANSSSGLAFAMQQEVEQLVKARLQRLLDEMDLITREEYDILNKRFERLEIKAAQMEKQLNKLNAASIKPKSGSASAKKVKKNTTKT